MAISRPQFILGITLALAAAPLAQASCNLLTRAEIQAALGKPVEEGKPNPANPLGICQYPVAGGGTFSILVKAVAPGETADRVMAELQKRKIAVAETPGLGDRSFFSSPGYGMVQLNTFKGGKYLIITLLVPGSSEAAQKAAAKALMLKALGRS